MINTMGQDANRALSLEADVIEVANNEETKNE